MGKLMGAGTQGKRMLTGESLSVTHCADSGAGMPRVALAVPPWAGSAG